MTSLWTFLVWTILLLVVDAQILDMFVFRALCNEDRGWTFYRSDPWNCNRYYACLSGVTVSGYCPPGEIFNDTSYQCQLPKGNDIRRCRDFVLASLERACGRNRLAKFPSPFSCGQFFDCSYISPSGGQANGAGGPLQLMECPYPSLYNVFSRTCQRFDQVNCQERPIPKAPCDYLQHQQLCRSSGCLPCSERHPSCVGLSNGAHPVSRYKSLFILCYSDRTLDVRKCNDQLVFSKQERKCVKAV